MKKNVIGILGIAVALVVAVLILSTEMMSPELVSVLMAGMIIVVILGIVAAVRGSRLWLILCAIGVGLAAFLIFAVVGP